MPTIHEWLHTATTQLAGAGIGSAKLDAEIILAHTLRKNRTFLHAHSDNTLISRHVEIADARLALRRDRTPLAYIIGHKEFYGRLFHVTPATLIPRPESEIIISLLKNQLSHNLSLLKEPPKKVVDVGTGTGCLGITAKLEVPELDVTLLDISHHALTVAKTNATQLAAKVATQTSNLLESYPFNPDIIIANLPYVDSTWQRSPETHYEPEVALFASDNGLSLIKRLVIQAASRLTPGGALILEVDPRQHESIVTFARKHGFSIVDRQQFGLYLQKA